ncbi:uncharacterized protein BKA55DRAFT_379768 [Fusarium redolens]|uniref:Uncharacterized protein n=1 Tax=Fusarium redolens TaxID=48865 RepID=A0A9P9H036_FUSRE|nr:uncharacterized protein BKA55DRAFT_379768 [Fusarium redolens]KAH7248551.1 hypothetical protein BKA55DRAFT_379768 [Fusarium redolens]
MTLLSRSLNPLLGSSYLSRSFEPIAWIFMVTPASHGSGEEQSSTLQHNHSKGNSSLCLRPVTFVSAGPSEPLKLLDMIPTFPLASSSQWLPQHRTAAERRSDAQRKGTKQHPAT